MCCSTIAITRCGAVAVLSLSRQHNNSDIVVLLSDKRHRVAWDDCDNSLSIAGFKCVKGPHNVAVLNLSASHGKDGILEFDGDLAAWCHNHVLAECEWFFIEDRDVLRSRVCLRLLGSGSF